MWTERQPRLSWGPPLQCGGSAAGAGAAGRRFVLVPGEGGDAGVEEEISMEVWIDCRSVARFICILHLMCRVAAGSPPACIFLTLWNTAGSTLRDSRFINPQAWPPCAIISSTPPHHHTSCTAGPGHPPLLYTPSCTIILHTSTLPAGPGHPIPRGRLPSPRLPGARAYRLHPPTGLRPLVLRGAGGGSS